MNDLNSIISTFSSDDQQRFASYLEKKNKRNDTKNIQLFKLLLNNNLSSEDICYKIYKNNSKGAYHALRKRLYQSIIDFIANVNLEEENSIDMQIIKYIIVSRTFLLHNKPIIAYKILDKAEVLASEHHLFSILNEIYHTKIQYAYLNPLININELIDTFKQNQKNHYLEDELNIVYAKIKQTLNNIAYKGEVLDFQSILNNTLKEHKISLSESMSFKSLYQLMTIVSISAFITHDYLKIEPFLLNTYNSIKTHKTKEKQLFYHIQVIYMIANALFRNKKFKESTKYLQQMHDLMMLKRKKYYNTFKLKYNLLLGLNYNYSNHQNKAIELLEYSIKLKHTDIESVLDIHLSLVMFYIQAKAYKKAQSIFSKFYHTDKWYIEKAGIEWIIKKNLADIILHIELQNIDFVESRLLSFKRNYYDYLKQINQERVITFLGFVELYYKKPEIVTSNTFKDKVEASFNWIESHKEDIFVMSFYSWLKSKMNKTDLYETTLDIIKQAKKELTIT
ncbi:hypothetical protein MBM09_14765 [Flaviramulus sp. BrNp1-15]|uniref:hypothetical protein n=1 Tax=Flaviramulus sp. BrNp1-15 TaxID=2916754 RepID=UPI001EE98116|nr:hypothetical protein [Flaviramulus sp. BrNp1-15]ULC59155.1 hypothetical protein MBM09_14765 [Flaviramulus sp. BrNp1-15]